MGRFTKKPKSPEEIIKDVDESAIAAGKISIPVIGNKPPMLGVVKVRICNSPKEEKHMKMDIRNVMFFNMFNCGDTCDIQDAKGIKIIGKHVTFESVSKNTFALTFFETKCECITKSDEDFKKTVESLSNAGFENDDGKEIAGDTASNKIIIA